MRNGKISETILRRSILKNISRSQNENIKGPAIGRDAAALPVKPEEIPVFSSAVISFTDFRQGKLAVLHCANNIAAAGGDFSGVMVNLILPPEADERKLKALMGEIEDACAREGGIVLGGHTEISPHASRTIAALTGIGLLPRGVREEGGMTCPEKDRICPGDYLILTKSIALETAALAAGVKKHELRKKFSENFIGRAENFWPLLSVRRDAEAVRSCPIHAMHDVSEGGIFGALWEIGSGSNLGLCVDIRKIPIRQETVEICEYFDMNPYMARSSGALLIVSPEKKSVLEALKEQGIEAASIGRMTKEKNRLILNGEEVRYLDKPGMDELYKLSL